MKNPRTHIRHFPYSPTGIVKAIKAAVRAARRGASVRVWAERKGRKR